MKKFQLVILEKCYFEVKPDFIVKVWVYYKKVFPIQSKLGQYLIYIHYWIQICHFPVEKVNYYCFNGTLFFQRDNSGWVCAIYYKSVVHFLIIHKLQKSVLPLFSYFSHFQLFTVSHVQMGFLIKNSGVIIKKLQKSHCAIFYLSLIFNHL